MPNDPNQKKSGSGPQQNAPQQPGQSKDQNDRSGREYQSPPIHRTDTKDATMGRPPGREAGQSNQGHSYQSQSGQGETQTQPTEFENENEAVAQQNRARDAGNTANPNRSTQGGPHGAGQTGQTGQQQAGQTDNT